MAKIIQKKARAHRYNTVEATIEYDYEKKEGTTLKDQINKTFSLIDEMLDLQVASLEKWANDTHKAKIIGERKTYLQETNTNGGVSDKERKALFAKVKNSNNKITWEKTWWDDLVKDGGKSLALQIQEKLKELTNE